MELVGTGGKVVLRVSDDGVGFDLNASQHQTGLGMTSMSERIRFVGGTLSICSRPSMGTQIEATISLSDGPVAVNGTSPPSPQERRPDIHPGFGPKNSAKVGGSNRSVLSSNATEPGGP